MKICKIIQVLRSVPSVLFWNAQNRSVRCISDESCLLELCHTKDLGENLSWSDRKHLVEVRGTGGAWKGLKLPHTQPCEGPGQRFSLQTPTTQHLAPWRPASFPRLSLVCLDSPEFTDLWEVVARVGLAPEKWDQWVLLWEQCILPCDWLIQLPESQVKDQP